MDNFIVSARKYRPSTFESVVGQKHITTTLKNSIKNKQLAQAFLFCGPRGVGKTTCARILAKTINCQNVSENTEPCNICISCTTFNNGQSFNIIELDAASNNSVDDIRSLIDQVRIAPQIGKYRVFIIDEVHMLSQQAFNAFLKTLEEPPAHAIFILATTEKNKILPTILSRCQIFDFYRIQLDDIAHHLEYIAQQENIKYDSDGLHIIAQKADGGLRDACSMFDQIVSFSEGNVTYDAVIQNLNILDYDYYFAITDCFLNKDIPNTLLRFNEIIQKGFDGLNFISGLSMHFRNLIVARNPQTLKLLETGNNIKEKYKEQGSKCTPAFIFNCLNICNEAEINYKQSKNPRLLIELALIKMALQGTAKPDEKKNDIIEDKPANSAENKTTEITKTALNISEKINQEIKPEEKITTVNQIAKPVNSGTIPAPKPALKTVSINIKQKVEEKKETTEVAQIELSELFTQEQLETEWNKFAAAMLLDKRHLIHTILIKNKPILKENNNVLFEVENILEKDQVTTILTELTHALRANLKNTSIRINTEIATKLEEEKKIFYTSLDKYKRMEQLNPNIILLRKKLDLDLI